jgi:hypothetical protein
MCYLLMNYLGHHDPIFSKGRTHHYDSNTLKNAETHMRDTHCLEEQGETWRKKGIALAQASGPIDGEYAKIILFRQLEFKNAFLEWVVLDGIKHRKAASIRLRRLFKIANKQAVEALPDFHGTVGSWIHDMFAHFEPQIIEEIANAKSRITISFDEWGSKYEKISVVGVVVHFINVKYDNVTRLIGLPELPGHRKTGVGKYMYSCDV